MKLIEGRTREFKEKMSPSFLKTVSAFANDEGGEIFFGVTDHGEPKGVVEVDKTRLRIENMVNDSITPRPEYEFRQTQIDGVTLLVLLIHPGQQTPYLYKGIAYQRKDTADAPVDYHQLQQLVLRGAQLKYEEMKTKSDQLSFKYLENYLTRVTGVSGITDDMLRTLYLKNAQNEFNLAAEIFADTNSFRKRGVDVMVFGQTINQIRFRKEIARRSVLEQFDQAVELFHRYYGFEEVEGLARVQKHRIPVEAYRESLANALVHRDWSLDRHVQIEMHESHVRITSPGGLPADLTEEDYLTRTISSLRNPIIANIFFRLKLIEQFGTGIQKIRNAYQGSNHKPLFEIFDNNLRLTLPEIAENTVELTFKEISLLDYMKINQPYSRSEIEQMVDLDKSAAVRVLNKLIQAGRVTRLGKGPNTQYVRELK